MPISTFWPLPLRARDSSASVMPCAADRPATRSAMELPTLTGGPSAKPVRSITPDSPCTMRSYPGREASGPLSPKPEIEQ